MTAAGLLQPVDIPTSCTSPCCQQPCAAPRRSTVVCLLPENQHHSLQGCSVTLQAFSLSLHICCGAQAGKKRRDFASGGCLSRASMVLSAPGGCCSPGLCAPPELRNEKLLRGQEGPTRLSVLLDAPLEGSKVSGS